MNQDPFLIPCPICGGKAQLNGNTSFGFACSCENCGLSTKHITTNEYREHLKSQGKEPPCYITNEEIEYEKLEAIKRWNTRIAPCYVELNLRHLSHETKRLIEKNELTELEAEQTGTKIIIDIDYNPSTCPQDLKDALEFAKSKNASLLIFSEDGETRKELKIYET